MPDEFVLFDLEFTAWEGSLERGWSGPGESCEIVQIGAIRVERGGPEQFSETGAFCALVHPRINPVLSDYFCRLTGITQERLDAEGIDLPAALRAFRNFIGGLASYANGSDFDSIVDNCRLIDVASPLDRERFHSLRSHLAGELGLPPSGLMTSSIPAVFGYSSDHLPAHDAVSDCRAILIGLCHLAKGDLPIMPSNAILK